MDEFVTCAQAFQKLKDLLLGWNEDICNGDVYANNLSQHLYRWLSSASNSKLYDPLLHRLVHKLMKKAFFQLLLQLRQLGCHVVYGNFHKLLL